MATRSKLPKPQLGGERARIKEWVNFDAWCCTLGRHVPPLAVAQFVWDHLADGRSHPTHAARLKENGSFVLPHRLMNDNLYRAIRLFLDCMSCPICGDLQTAEEAISNMKAHEPSTASEANDSLRDGQHEASKPVWRCLSCLACAADVRLACDDADVHRLCLREGRIAEPDGYAALARDVALPHQHRRGRE